MAYAFMSKYFTEDQRAPSRLKLLKWSINKAIKPGLFLEFGVWKGASLKFLAECRPDKRFYGFDTFKGLPESWSKFYPRGHGKLDNLPYIPGDVVLIEGLFQDTLEPFLEEHNEPVSFIHLDADLYSSTNYVLSTLADANRLQKGTIIQFDQVFYQDSPNTVLDDEYRAYQDFMRKYDVQVRWLKFYQRTVNERWLHFLRRRRRKATIRASLLIESFMIKEMHNAQV